MTRRRVLVVAMADSVHTARWLAQFRDDPIDVELFPSTPHRRLHPLIMELRDGAGAMRLSISPWMTRGALVSGVADLLLRNRVRSRMLRRRIRLIEPEVVHAMETQHAGYLACDAMAAAERHMVLTVWGSDFTWFGRREAHRRRIQHVLSRTSQLVVECGRDEAFARRNGYRGPTAIRIPASGATEGNASQTVASQRSTLMVKGYSGFMGMGPATIDGLEANADLLARTPVIVFSASLRTRVRSARARTRTGLDIRCIPKHALSNDEMLGLLADARALISLSRSDGFPGVVREALSCGTFVIHSDTACLDEWVGDTDHLRLVDVSCAASIRSGIRQGLHDAFNDVVVDRAGVSLRERAIATWSPAALHPLIAGFYDRLIHVTEARRSLIAP